MVLIVGGGVTGLSAALALRELGYHGQIRIIAAEAIPPYERPTLSKSFLRDQAVEVPVTLRSPHALAEAAIELDLGTEAHGLDPKRQTIVGARGEELVYDMLLLAPGARARKLDLPGANLRGVHYLRDVADALALRPRLRHGREVVIVGGGVVGLEVAATAAALGASVTVLEATSQIMGRVGPADMARRLAAHHEARGVRVETAVRVSGLEGTSDRVRGVRLDGGRLASADTVIVGVGAEPRTSLAAQGGLAVDDGIVVDEYFRSSAPRIFAAGDAAMVHHAAEDRHLRLEQWSVAERQGCHAAASMLGFGQPYRDVPWMWSDQHELHFQATGFGFADTDVVTRGDITQRGGVQYFGIRDGRLRAACGLSVGTGVARAIRSAQGLIERGVAVDAEQLADPGLDLRRILRTTTDQH
jgi:3-phenylpropionate/trans-cinnamate dioxygenase ferredoxin reductase component